MWHPFLCCAKVWDRIHVALLLFSWVVSPCKPPTLKNSSDTSQSTRYFRCKKAKSSDK